MSYLVDTNVISELRRREPAFTAAVRGAPVFPEGTGLDPGRFLADLAGDVRRAGVVVRELGTATISATELREVLGA